MLQPRAWEFAAAVAAVGKLMTVLPRGREFAAAVAENRRLTVTLHRACELAAAVAGTLELEVLLLGGLGFATGGREVLGVGDSLAEGLRVVTAWAGIWELTAAPPRACEFAMGGHRWTPTSSPTVSSTRQRVREPPRSICSTENLEGVCNTNARTRGGGWR